MDTEVIQGLCRESLGCIKPFSAYNIFGRKRTPRIQKILDRLMLSIAELNFLSNWSATVTDLGFRVQG